MNDRSLKKSLPGKSNRPADENLALFSVNREASLDVLFKLGREQAKVAKPEAEDVKKLGNDSLYTIPEVPLGTLSRLVLEARNTTFKLHSISTTRATSRSETESDPSSRPTRSGSTIRPSNIPTLRSSSAPKKTTTATSASVSTPKRTVSRSLTPVSRKTPSPSLTPSRTSTTTSTTPSFKKSGDAQRSRSLTPRSKPQVSENSSKSNVRSSSVSSRGCVRRDGCTSASTTPQTPPRIKETVTLAFGRPVGNVNSPKRNTSPDVTKTRPKGRSASPSLIPTFSGASHTTSTPKSVKPSATVADSTRSGRKLPRASVQMAINHLDVARNGKVGKHAFSSTTLYPHSIRSSSGLRKQCGSSEGSCSSSNHEEEEGRSLAKEGDNTENKNDSARYDAFLNVKDVKDTNWLLNIDDESHHSLIFDNAFDSPPDLFSPR
ncbi:hypothetical protein CARUB_v10017291mg [Capsella rubella]|uniref:Uncharacterized protein n=1 Tax=Capsella rubella TaxID=81985 RepID=R0FNM7_9BRAS|nr:mucin-5B [Capsella rubella]EOA24072.1 hypothetical protein CARUB_v10017291mg [Capsella rubella]